MSLESIVLDRSDPKNIKVKVLDQLLLPYTSKYIEISSIDDGYKVIKEMQVRGAPAIAIVGSLSILGEVQRLQNEGSSGISGIYNMNSWDSIRDHLHQKIIWLLGSRPTAVNLGNAITVIEEILRSSRSLEDFDDALYSFVTNLIDEDYVNNKKMGDNGSEHLLNLLKKENFKGGFAVLTICNTGSLATSGYGTALGAIRSLWHASKLQNIPETKYPHIEIDAIEGPKLEIVYPLETRPYNQGSRLTAYELVEDNIPAQLITDSSVAYRVATSKYPVKAAFVGADRIVRNGDTANKIGTYQLAILCKSLGIKVFVVAPKSTVDKSTENGKDIIVEERPASEFKLVSGASIDQSTGQPKFNEQGEAISGKVGITHPKVDVWNPSFDVTPYSLIDGIITEVGVFTKSKDGTFDLSELFNS